MVLAHHRGGDHEGLAHGDRLTGRLRTPSTGEESRRGDCGNERIAEADARIPEVGGNECRVHSAHDLLQSVARVIQPSAGACPSDATER